MAGEYREIRMGPLPAIQVIFRLPGAMWPVWLCLN